MSQAERADHAFAVPAFGDSPFLAGCLDSLSAQSVRSRVVVCTATPSAFIEAVCRSRGVELRINAEQRGIGHDWNWAMAASGSRYVTLAHQDDVYRPRFLERTLELFARHPDRSLCFTGYDEVDDVGRPCSSRISRTKHLIERLTLGRREAPSALRIRAFLSFGNPLPCSSVTLDRERLPAFSFSTDYASNLDWDAWWRLHSEGHGFLHAPERLVGRRHNALTETSRLIQDGRRAREDRRMFRRIWPAPIDRALAALYAGGYR